MTVDTNTVNETRKGGARGARISVPCHTRRQAIRLLAHRGGAAALSKLLPLTSSVPTRGRKWLGVRLSRRRRVVSGGDETYVGLPRGVDARGCCRPCARRDDRETQHVGSCVRACVRGLSCSGSSPGRPKRTFTAATTFAKLSAVPEEVRRTNMLIQLPPVLRNPLHKATLQAT
eukprot:6693182-Prymnesium_polylepis.1